MVCSLADQKQADCCRQLEDIWLQRIQEMLLKQGVYECAHVYNSLLAQQTQTNKH